MADQTRQSSSTTSPQQHRLNRPDLPPKPSRPLSMTDLMDKLGETAQHVLDLRADLTFLHDRHDRLQADHNLLHMEHSKLRKAHENRCLEHDKLQHDYDALKLYLDTFHEEHKTVLTEHERLKEEVEKLGRAGSSSSSPTSRREELTTLRSPAVETKDSRRPETWPSGPNLLKSQDSKDKDVSQSKDNNTDETHLDNNNTHTLKTEVNRISSDLESVKRDQGKINSEIASMKMSQGQINSHLADNKKYNDKIYSFLANIRAGHDKINADLTTVKTVHDRMNTEIQTVKTDHDAVNAEIETIKTGDSAAMATLRTKLGEARPLFSAYGSYHQAQERGNKPERSRDSAEDDSRKQAMLFRDVHLNDGGHFSTDTGRFTAPQPGMYFFRTNVACHVKDKVMEFYLVIDQEPYCCIVCKSEERRSESMVLRLAAGQQVWIRCSFLLEKGSDVFQSFFSGALVLPFP